MQTDIHTLQPSYVYKYISYVFSLCLFLFDVTQIISFSNEQAIKNTFVHTDIFNDTSCMTFPKNKLSAVSNDFWTRTRQENETDNDTEIILRSKISTFRP